MKKNLLIAALSALLVTSGVAPLSAAGPAKRSLNLNANTALTAKYSESISLNNGAQQISAVERQQIKRVVKAAAAAETTVTVPFTHTLGKNELETNTALYTAIDANNDGRTWKVGGFTSYSVCMKPKADDVTHTDDWMVSPKIELKAGVEYLMKVEVATALSKETYEDQLEIKMGTGATVADMTTELVPVVTTHGSSPVQVEKKFKVTADGTYHIGFHAMSDKAKSGNNKLCNFSITEAASVVTPAAAGTLEYTLFPKGELKVHIKYTAPLKNTAGEDLTEIAKVEITDGTWKKFTYENVTPGQVIECDGELMQGPNNMIQAYAFLKNPAGEFVKGEKAEKGFFYAGLDNPLTPENAVATVSEDGKKVTVSWDAVPEIGEKGGYVDPAKVVYYIFDAFGNYYDPALATTSETSYEFDYSDLAQQDFVAFQITAGMEETYYSLAASTNIVAAGAPYVAPWYESFAENQFTYTWCVDPESSNMMVGSVDDHQLQTNADDPEAEPVYLTSQDKDNGFLFFMPMNKDDMYGLISGKIDISKAKNPVLEFFYQGFGSALDAMVSTDGGTTFEVVKTIDLKETPATDWTLAQVDLKPFLAKKNIQIEIRLRAIHNDETHTWSVPVDNIRVRDLVSSELNVVSFKAPNSVKAGSKFALTTTVENRGLKTETVVQAILYRNGDMVNASVLDVIKPNEVLTFTMEDEARLDDEDKVAYKVEIMLPEDADMSNNTATDTVTVIMPNYPVVTNLAAQTQFGNIDLTWTAPEIGTMTQPRDITEDFENPAYEPMTIENFGEWTMVDGDGKGTYYCQNWNETGNPYRTAPQAYQLYNPVVAGVTPELLVDVPPHSGEQLLVAWSTNGQNDNWLISPMLSGKAQTVSFFARSFLITFPESFEVLYSTIDMKVESFKKIETVENYPENNQLPEVWNEYKAALPEGAKYFAIRHNSYDSFAMYVDDIKFQAAPVVPEDFKLEGYNVYRNGEKVNQALVTETSFKDKVDQDAMYTYRVSAVYNYGESRHSEPVDVIVENSGVEDIVAPQGPATYYNLQGMKVSESNLVPGVYIKTVGNRAEKVVVK